MSYKELDYSNWAPERIAKFDIQLATRGFDDTDWWSLDLTIAKFVLPRLKAFREGTKSFPASISSEEWDDILDKMINAFELANSEDWPVLKENDAKVAQEGFQLFGKWFMHLWS